MDVLKLLLQFLSQGSVSAVIALLSMAVAFLVWERRSLTKQLTNSQQQILEAKDKETETVKQIIEKYHQGNLDLIQALNEIKIVLTTITTRNRG